MSVVSGEMNDGSLTIQVIGKHRLAGVYNIVNVFNTNVHNTFLYEVHNTFLHNSSYVRLFR